MRSFYHYMMRYRGVKKPTYESRLADWMFRDHDFPKQSTSYHEISSYLEWNIPFTEAVQVFDRLWDDYSTNES
ncbi:YozE family protein [Aquibacillus rhizosphaerae]|uniref:YozE family protein n=1 Tax=Aquibacillus rhizosphaerae TaxID=3051431 RepID=A0ABT7L1I4_9BACI|nr:YozE family protein [Aquibacillus sp. LR5S19]MDL4839718.1 YozE family protein [Aquibacillus sp. LR5S19]